MKIINNENNRSLLLQIDYDGLLIPLEKRQKDINFFWLAESIINEAFVFGEPKQARAYACWNKKRYGHTAEIFKQADIEPVIIHGQEKNQADIEIIHHLLASVPYFDRFVLITNDDDLLPGIEAIHNAGKEMILMYWPEAVNKRLLNSIPPEFCISLEKVLNLGPFNEPQSAQSFSANDLRTAIIAAELLIRRSNKSWLHYQVLIESLSQYSYYTADQLIRTAIASSYLILDHYDNGKRHIIFINYESSEVINTITLLDLILGIMSDNLHKNSIKNTDDLAKIITQNLLIKKLYDNPSFWLNLLQKFGIIQRRSRRIPGSLSLGYTLEFNYSHPSIHSNLKSIAMAA